MAWEIGYYSLAPGATASYWFTFANSAYVGAQPVLAVPYYFTYERWRFTVLDYGISRDGNSYAYWVTVRNDGATNASFKLVGGGVT